MDVFLSEAKITERIEELGREITKDYNGEEVVVVGVLNGAFMFCADLIRKIDAPVTLEFIKASSYKGTTSTGEVELDLSSTSSIEGKHVLLVEDIVDTGLTIKNIFADFKKKSPKSLKLASLLFKPARNEHPVDIDYLGFEIEDKFVIGYGLDYDGRYRELPYIGIYNAD